MAFLRSDQAAITVFVRDNNGDLKEYVDGASWATLSGGVIESDGGKTRPGGMGRKVALGGPADRSDVTVTTQLSDAVLLWHRTLENRVGRSDAVVAWQYLNRDGSLKTGDRYKHKVTGVLKSVSLPDTDGDSGDAAMYTLVIECDEVAS